VNAHAGGMLEVSRVQADGRSVDQKFATRWCGIPVGGDGAGNPRAGVYRYHIELAPEWRGAAHQPRRSRSVVLR